MSTLVNSLRLVFNVLVRFTCMSANMTPKANDRTVISKRRGGESLGTDYHFHEKSEGEPHQERMQNCRSRLGDYEWDFLR